MTRYLLEQVKNQNVSAAIHSTDEYFMTPDGRYVFYAGKLYEYHLENLHQFTQSLRAGINLVICDNINLLPWQTAPYTDVARKFGYRIVFLTFSPRELQEHLETQIVTAQRPDAHGVPEAVLARFIQEYYSYTPLLNPESPVIPSLHSHYEWNREKHQPERSLQPCAHFDLDDTIHIHPQNFDEIKVDIWQRVRGK